MPAEDRRRLVAAEIMRAVYFETLNRIERSGYDVFTSRVRVPRPTQAIIALKQFLWRRLHRRPVDRCPAAGSRSMKPVDFDVDRHRRRIRRV